MLHSALRDDLLQTDFWIIAPVSSSKSSWSFSWLWATAVPCGMPRHSLDVQVTVGSTGSSMKIRLGLDRVYVQAKRYGPKQPVGRPDVQGFVGSLVGLGATKGVFVTTSSFSHDTLEYVRHLSQRVILIDGEKLTELMIEHNVGVRLNRAD